MKKILGAIRSRQLFRLMILFGVLTLLFPAFVGEAVAQRKKPAAKKPAAKKAATKKPAAKKAAPNARKARNSRAGKRNSRNARNNRNSRNTRNARNTNNARSTSRSAAPVVAVERGVPTNVEIIVNAAMSPIRSQASFTAPFVANAKLGTSLTAVEKSAQWYRVEYMAGGRMATGWIAANTVAEVNGSDRTDVYRLITDRNYRADMDFNTSVDLYDFLGKASVEMPVSEKAADIELKRIFALRAAASRINRQNRVSAPFSDFVNQRNGEILFNEVTGEYLVSSNLFWNLADKYRNLPSGDIIGWYGARNPIPGECGRLVNCHIFLARMTDGEYLSIFPNGRSANDAMRNISFMLEPLVTDLQSRNIFMSPTDADDKVELGSLIKELRTIVSRSGIPERQNVLAKLDRIEKGYL
jgi:hypothetical protein